MLYSFTVLQLQPSLQRQLYCCSKGNFIVSCGPPVKMSLFGNNIRLKGFMFIGFFCICGGKYMFACIMFTCKKKCKITPYRFIKLFSFSSFINFIQLSLTVM